MLFLAAMNLSRCTVVALVCTVFLASASLWAREKGGSSGGGMGGGNHAKKACLLTEKDANLRLTYMTLLKGFASPGEAVKNLTESCPFNKEEAKCVMDKIFDGYDESEIVEEILSCRGSDMNTA